LESLTLLRFGATHLSSFRLSYLKRARLHYVSDPDFPITSSFFESGHAHGHGHGHEKEEENLKGLYTRPFFTGEI
jgi:hypothetical protein